MPFSKDGKVECKICKKKLARISLRLHEQTHKPARFSCEICGVKKTQKVSLVNHLKLVHNIGPPSKFECLFCKKQFVNFEALHKHLRSHTMERPFLCDLCPTECNTKFSLRVHKKRIHDKIFNFKCTKCPKVFTCQENLSTHLKYHLKTANKKIKCEFCQKLFSTNRLLNFHIMNIHIKEKPEVCGICKNSFGNKQQLEVHMRTHTGERPYSCQFCPKTFANMSGIKAHVWNVHKKDERPFQCKTCGKKFASRDKLQRHEVLHQDRIQKPFVCEVCGIGFGFQNGLRLHLRIHTGNK